MTEWWVSKSTGRVAQEYRHRRARSSTPSTRARAVSETPPTFRHYCPAAMARISCLPRRTLTSKKKSLPRASTYRRRVFKVYES